MDVVDKSQADLGHVRDEGTCPHHDGGTTCVVGLVGNHIPKVANALLRVPLAVKCP